MKQLKPDATAVYVAAHQAAEAIEEAIEAEIPLIVAVAEHIPLHDLLRVRIAPVPLLSVNNLTQLRSTLCYKRNQSLVLSAQIHLG